MLLSLDQSKAEEFSNALSYQGISNWIVGTIDNKQPKLVRISKKVNYLEIDKI